MRISVTGPVSPDAAWERYATPSLWATWAPQIRGVSYAAPTLSAGTRGVVHGPWPVRVPFTVTAVDPDARRWAWRVGGLVAMEHGVDGHDGGCAAWVELPGPAAAWGAYAPLARLALRRLVAP
jgi:hypothetical protein